MPGLDGVPTEFYERFWEVVGGDVVEVFREFMQTGKVGEGFAVRVGVLLHKKGDREALWNWRPITLLNVDYKLFTKELASQMRKVLGEGKKKIRHAR